VSERAIKRASERASDERATEQASVFVVVGGAAAATVTVYRPE